MNSSNYLTLLRGGEPFRLLFPVGTALGLLGVLLWPLWVWGPPHAYPAVAHARIMIEGFQTAFVLGFLGTALPRMLGVPRLGAAAASGYAIALMVLSGLHLRGWHVAGDAVMAATLLTFVGDLLRRARQRDDVPPPAFVLVLSGLLCGVVGAVMLAVEGLRPPAFGSVLPAVARALLYQGYLLLPIMGVGAFLLPRFFGQPSRQAFPESRQPPPGWVRRAAFAAACGAVALTGLMLAALDWPSIGNLLVAVAFSTFVAVEFRAHRGGWPVGSLGSALRVALISLPLGYLALAIWPMHRTSLLHLVFITGFSLLTLTVASRVLLGHSGQSHRFGKASWPIRALVALLVLAMVTRVSADWMPAVRLTHYGYAAVCWAIGVVIWAGALLPAVRRADVES